MAEYNETSFVGVTGGDKESAFSGPINDLNTARSMDGLKEEDSSITVIGQNFCAGTTSHGVPHVYNASSLGKKLLWAFISLASLAALAYHMYNLIDTYAQNDTTTEIKVNNSIRQLEFPAVTLCNNNMLKSTALIGAFDDLITAAEAESDRVSAQSQLLDTIMYEYALLDDAVKLDLGHQLNDTLYAATFNSDSIDRNADFVHFFDPWQGNCYTFNHFSVANVSKQSRAGHTYGLALSVNLEQYDYVPFLTEASGLRVLVHDRDEMPFPKDHGYDIAPNTLTRMRVHRNVNSRLDGRYGDCVTDETAPETVYQFSYGYAYSRSACEKTCIQEEIITSCTCYVPQVPYNVTFFTKIENEVGPCDNTNATDSGCMDAVWNDFAEGTLLCDICEERCHEVLYDITTSSTVWPAPTYLDELVGSLAADYPDLEREISLHYTDAATGIVDLSTAVQENLLRIEIFYNRIAVTQIVETPSVTDFQFISDIGGSLGLWVGWSMLTIFEFGELMMDMLILCCTKLRAGQRQRTYPQKVGGSQVNS